MTCTSNPKSPTRDRSPSPKQSSSVSLRTLPQPASQHLLPHAISATEVGRRGNRRCCRRSRTCFGKIEKLLPGTKVDSWHPRHWKHPHQRRKGGKGHSIPSFIIRSPHSGIHISSLVFPSDPDPSQTSKWTSQPSPSLTPLAPLPRPPPGSYIGPNPWVQQLIAISKRGSGILGKSGVHCCGTPPRVVPRIHM